MNNFFRVVSILFISAIAFNCRLSASPLCNVVGTRLNMAQHLNSGSCLRSNNGRFLLNMQGDGNLVLYDIDKLVQLWATATAGKSVSYAAVDGNSGSLELFDFSGRIVYSNNLNYGSGIYFLLVQDDGNFTLQKNFWSTVVGWGSGPSHVVFPPPACNQTGNHINLGDQLAIGQKLKTGQCLVSPLTRYELSLQSDGNLILIDQATQSQQWTSNTSNLSVSYAAVLSDGELALFDALGNQVWSNSAIGPDGSYFAAIQDNGNFVTYQAPGWTSNTTISGTQLLAGGYLDQQVGNWKYCVSQACAPHQPLVHKFTQNTNTVSLDGAAIDSYQAGGSNYWGILYYLSKPVPSGSTTYSAEWSYQVDNSTGIQALEFDFPVVINNQKYYFGTQCVKNSYWEYWIPNPNPPGGGSWHHTTVPCTQTTAGVWHKVRWIGSRTGSQFTYSKLETDGQLYDLSITVSAHPRGNSDPANGTITIQFQPDGRPNTPGFHEYIDSVNAWLW